MLWDVELENSAQAAWKQALLTAEEEAEVKDLVWNIDRMWCGIRQGIVEAFVIMIGTASIWQPQFWDIVILGVLTQVVIAGPRLVALLYFSRRLHAMGR